MNKTVIVLISILWATCLYGCGKINQSDNTKLPFYLDFDLTPVWIEPSDLEYASIHTVSPFALQNQYGQMRSSADLDGKIYVANFFFANCTQICPTMRSNLMLVQDAFQEEEAVRIISHTVLPESDTVPVLRAYAAANNIIEGKWDLVTGTREEIYTLAENSYFAEIKGEVDTEFLHTETFYLVDAKRRIRGVYNGTLEFDVNRLIEDIALLKKELAV